MQLFKKLQKKIKLPQTHQQFDDLVLLVCKRYGIEDTHHAGAIISVAIRHLPNDQAYTTLQYLAESVMKNVANFVANHKGQMLQHEGQIRILIDELKKNPLNQQARDELQKASDEGSPIAQQALQSLEGDKSHLSVVQDSHHEGSF